MAPSPSWGGTALLRVFGADGDDLAVGEAHLGDGLAGEGEPPAGALGRLDLQKVAGAEVLHRLDPAQRLALHRFGGKADQVRQIELVFVLGRRKGRAWNVQAKAPKGLGGLAGLDLLGAGGDAALHGPRAGQGQRRSAVLTQKDPIADERHRVLCVGRDADLALHPERAGHAADQDEALGHRAALGLFVRRLFGGRGLLGGGLGGRGFLGRSSLGRSSLGGSLFDGRLLGGGGGGGGLSRGGGAVGFALGPLLGAVLGLLTGLALFRVVAGRALDHAVGGREARHAIGRLGALLQPLLNPFQLQGDPVGVVTLQQRVVGAHLLDEAAVARRVAVGDDDRVVGALLGAATG